MDARTLATALVAHLDGTSGIDAYLSQGPRPPAGKTVVLHPGDAIENGPLGDPDRDLRLTFQTTSIGTTPEQALWTHDQIVARLLRAEVLVGGGAVTLPLWRADDQAPVLVDDDLAEPLWFVPCRWVAETRGN